MRIGPIGSNPFIDLQRTNDLIKKTDIARFLRKKDVNYLERQAENAQTLDVSFEKNLEQAKIDISL